jgi:hypothetical protein
MPEIGGHRVEGHGLGWCKDWRLLGNRGLYVYDWKHWSGPYERIIRERRVALMSTVMTHPDDRR